MHVACRALCALFLVSALAASPIAASASTISEARAAAEKARLEKLLAGKTAGKPRVCIRSRDAGTSIPIGENTIIYRVSRKLLYRNDIEGGCPGMDINRALIVRLYSSSICRGDIVTPTDLQTGFSAGGCALGDFVPYTQP